MGVSGPSWSQGLGARCKGRDAYVDAWAVEKLAKVVEGVIEVRAIVARHTQPEILDSSIFRSTFRPHPNEATLRTPVEEHLLETFLNACKLAAWMAGNTDAYREWNVVEAFLLGGSSSTGGIGGVGRVEYGDAMRRHLEELLAPVLEEKRAS